ncbi:MAG: Crp/Fnr family transcriptional regulator [Verrucomicrobiota bacterium]
MSTLAAIIAEQPFFKGLSAEHLRTLADSAMQTWFEADELIFHEDDVANRFYLILEGKVALESSLANGDSVVLQTLGPGELLGWSWLFSPYIWKLHARALEPTEAIFFYGTRLRAQCEDNHDLGYELFKRISEVMMHRLHSTRRKLFASLSDAHPGNGLRHVRDSGRESSVGAFNH